MNVYEIVTNRIIEQLEEGVVPWKMPWNHRGVARRWKVDKPYRGINAMILPPGEYASLKQIKEAGGRVLPDQLKKWHMVVYWHWYLVKLDGGEVGEASGDEDAPLVKRAKPFYSRVYEINKQCEGMESRFSEDEEDKLDFNPVEKAEEMIKAYKDAPRVVYSLQGASYHPIFDYINMPFKEDFHSIEEYYSTLFHELVHSTGAINRLNREGITDMTRFGSDKYAKEELIAEMGASMLCSMAGIESVQLEDNSASYIAGWLKKLNDDKKFIFSAASKAQAAVDFMLDITYEEQDPLQVEEEQSKKLEFPA